MTSKYKAVIYDCDGVMFDSFEANLAFYQRIMDRMGREPIDRANVEQMLVLHTYANREVLAHFFPEPADYAAAVQHAGSIDYLDLVPLMIMEEGYRETLDALAGRVELAVCTNRSTSMETVLASFDLAGYFSCVMTANQVDNPKPHPDPLYKVLEQLGIAPAEALFVGDSEVDYLAASAAGVPFIAYKNGYPALARIDRHQDLLQFL